MSRSPSAIAENKNKANRATAIKNIHTMISLKLISHESANPKIIGVIIYLNIISTPQFDS